MRLQSKLESTDDDRDRIAEWTQEKARLTAELTNNNALIFRHSGPGFGGYRRIEIIARLAGGEAKAPGKGGAKAPDKPKAAKVAGGTNGVVPRETTPEQLAAAAAANAAVIADDFREPTDAEKEKLAAELAEVHRIAEAARRKKARLLPRIDLEAPARLPGAPVPSIGAILEVKGKALGIAIVPESPDDS